MQVVHLWLHLFFAVFLPYAIPHPLTVHQYLDISMLGYTMHTCGRMLSKTVNQLLLLLLDMWHAMKAQISASDACFY